MRAREFLQLSRLTADDILKRNGRQSSDPHALPGAGAGGGCTRTTQDG